MGRLEVLGSLLLPASCPVCGAAGGAPCATCWSALRPAFPGALPVGLDRCRSLLAYEGVGRELLARLKYRNARSSLAWLASGMAALAARWPVDVVTWAPTSATRRRARGYDQAELLARAVASSLSQPCVPLLRRVPGPPQTGRDRAQRRLGPTFTSCFPPRSLPAPDAVLLVDDLLTTGATLSAAANVLRAAGAERVLAVTAGRTPWRGGGPSATPGATPLKVTPQAADP